MKSLLLAMSIALDSSGTAATRTDRVLTTKGLAPVSIGMTVAQMEAAMGTKLSVEYADDESCGLAYRADQRDGDVSYMIEEGILTRIEVQSVGGRQDGFGRVATAAGIRIGDPAKKVRRAYGAALTTESDPYDESPKDRDYRIGGPHKGAGFIFQIRDGKVQEFRAGRYPSVAYIEGCE